MPSFKPKATKKIKFCKKDATTLDGKHKEFITEFMKDENDNIPTLKEERKHLQQKLRLETASLMIEQVMDINDRIKEITNNIKALKTKKQDYFLDNSKYIFEYFENKKNISTSVKSDNNHNTSNNNPASSSSSINVKSKMVNDFFKIKTDKPAGEQFPNNHSNNNNACDMNCSEVTNKNIVQKYLSNIDESFLDVNSFVRATDICSYCFKGEMIPLDDDGVLICNVCSTNVPYLIENEKPSYKEPPKEVCFYAYKRINHFKEIIAQFQGKETTQISFEVIETIKQQIKKERIDQTQLTHYKTKEILKKLGLNKYYEHIAFIKNKLGIKPPVMSPELEEKLFNLFIELQAPYAKHCPDYRVNFSNYYYVLYKLCELLGETDYIVDIPMLKDREKLIEQDETWKKMCQELDWEFIPTV